ncbi:peptidyl-prolyl cis-trans isomerase [Fictibacillus terranigra]|uniref:Peptidyl-prolyl cis-trans isomerase n=1 Tax=Fictibacillus terranigra TaxID=3058424 RepID=A0ABT8E6P3_9BACL|nr:peptidyl-prolyl cis-trans isomerase [Fictibacillus sp. CENA-BCM004]MDN4073583.1 peptidyl-prolyl cis-trans isomerase [Fictibacillus sp. CENA-BCM004]
MDFILELKGKVRYNLSMDPGVFIFDDRKFDLTTYFDDKESLESEEEKYLKAVSSHWDKEIIEGSAPPEKKPSSRKSLKETIATGTFGIGFGHFIKNAEPDASASHIEIHTENGVEEITLEDGLKAVLGFSLNGKPLKEDGPVHFYFGDGRNKEIPIKNIRSFIIK